MPLIETELYYGQNNSGKTLLVHCQCIDEREPASTYRNWH